MPPLKAAIILLALSITSVLSNPITPTSRSTTNSGKRGLAYSNPPTLIKYFNKHGSKVTWAYDWDSHLDPNFPSYLEFVPMLWGNDSGHTAVWNKNVNAAIKKGTKNILTFNEPDMCGGGQSCITPQAAVASWRTFVEPFAGKVKLGAPAVTEVGTPWLLTFLSLCANCTIDFIPMHIYNSASNVPYYKAHILDIHNQTGKSIWLTEFSATGNQTAFLQTMLPWLDAQPYITRYAWFGCFAGYSGSVCGSTGPTALGTVYEFL